MNQPIEISSRELPNLIARLRREGKRASSITATATGYTVNAICEHPAQPDLFGRHKPLPRATQAKLDTQDSC